MKARLLVAAAATVLIGTAVPVLAGDVGVGVGPAGVTVGEGHRDRDVVREREVIGIAMVVETMTATPSL